MGYGCGEAVVCCPMVGNRSGGVWFIFGPTGLVFPCLSGFRVVMVFKCFITLVYVVVFFGLFLLNVIVIMFYCGFVLEPEF